jgi:hypothetical protein
MCTETGQVIPPLRLNSKAKAAMKFKGHNDNYVSAITASRHKYL